MSQHISSHIFFQMYYSIKLIRHAKLQMNICNIYDSERVRTS